MRTVGIDQIAYKLMFTLRDLLVDVKDYVPLQEGASVVYYILCRDCEGVYIGRTS